jgi:DNA-binding response OmpR family regulator
MDRIKVFLVDDEKEFVTTLSERIEMRNFCCNVAFSGEQALEWLGRESCDVMVLDLNMPGMDGIETLKKARVIRPEIKTIILTGHGSEKERLQAMDLGAFAYLQKPVSLDTLMDAINSARLDPWENA